MLDQQHRKSFCDAPDLGIPKTRLAALHSTGLDPSKCVVELWLRSELKSNVILHRLKGPIFGLATCFSVNANTFGDQRFEQPPPSALRCVGIVFSLVSSLSVPENGRGVMDLMDSMRDANTSD